MNMQEARENVDFLLNRFKIERYFYMIVTGCSVLLLGVCIFFLFKKEPEKQIPQILTMLGPTGLITYSASKILKMWTDCLDLFKEGKQG